MEAQTITFKEFLPDQPDLNNPGLLEALNCLPVDAAFKSYAPLAGSGGAFPNTVMGAYRTRFAGQIYGAGLDTAGTGGLYYQYTGAAWTAKATAGAYGPPDLSVDFTEFDNLCIGTDDGNGAQCITIGSTGNFSTLATTGTNPNAGRIAIIGRFAMAGRFPNGGSGTTNSYVRWSAIDDVRAWPAPNSATAIAQQSGEQWLDSRFGIGSSIVGGDQYGLIFQSHGINRATYVGGGIVFQFDNFEAERGAFFMNGTIQVSNKTYFVSDKGFFVTDGVEVRNIGAGRVNRTFLAEVDPTYAHKMTCALDTERNLIYWSYPNTSATSGRPNRLLIYNYVEDRWTRGNQQSPLIFSGGDLGITPPIREYPMGFQQSLTLGSFNGTPGSAIFTTGEAEPVPGRVARVSGIKPLADVTANAATIALGTRSGIADAVSFTSEVTANSATGFCDFRSEARYQRARLTLSGTFNSVQGLEFLMVGSGKR